MSFVDTEIADGWTVEALVELILLFILMTGLGTTIEVEEFKVRGPSPQQQKTSAPKYPFCPALYFKTNEKGEWSEREREKRKKWEIFVGGGGLPVKTDQQGVWWCKVLNVNILAFSSFVLCLLPPFFFRTTSKHRRELSRASLCNTSSSHPWHMALQRASTWTSESHLFPPPHVMPPFFH
jgi:hypothetical protein